MIRTALGFVLVGTTLWLALLGAAPQPGLRKVMRVQVLTALPDGTHTSRTLHHLFPEPGTDAESMDSACSYGGYRCGVGATGGFSDSFRPSAAGLVYHYGWDNVVLHMKRYGTLRFPVQPGTREFQIDDVRFHVEIWIGSTTAPGRWRE